MPRDVPEWIGAKDSTALPARVKARIILDQDGLCGCGCGVKLGVAGDLVEFDHRIALINGGENRESNFDALRQCCHKLKTKEDVRTKAKIARVRSKHLGIRPAPKSTIAGSKGSKFKRKIDGTVVLR